MDVKLKRIYSWTRKDLSKKGTPKLLEKIAALRQSRALPNKAAIFEALLDANNGLHGDERIVVYSHSGLKEPVNVELGKTFTAEFSADWADYADAAFAERLKQEGFQVTYADFANSKLGGGIFGESFAQEEQMIAQSLDFLLVVSIFQASRLYTRRLPLFERDAQERRFAAFSGENTADPLLLTNIRFAPESPVNVIAFAAPELRCYDGGRAYSWPLVLDLFSGAVTAFAMLKSHDRQLRKKSYVNSGLWGAGAFGHNRAVSIAIQQIAARCVFEDEDVVHFWGVPNEIACKANKLADAALKSSASVRAVLQAVLTLIAPDPELWC